MNKELNLNINPLVSKLSGLFSCGKNALYKSKDIALRLVQSAIHNQSLEAMFKLTKYLSADRILSKLHDINLSDAEHLIKKYNSKLKLPNKVDLAIDFTDKIYYGDKNHIDVIGSKDGKYVRRYIELSIVNPAFFIDALQVNLFNNNKKELIKKMINRFYRRYNTGIRLLLVDRGFFSKAVVKYFVDNNIKFIMPAVKDRKIKKLCELYAKGEIGSRIKYEFGDVIISLLFLKVDGEIFVYATNTRNSALKCYILYKKRWQIETNFREQNKFTFKTTSIDFKIRYLAFILGGLLFNAWQLTRKLLPYDLESYLFKNYLVEEILRIWKGVSKSGVVKSIDYFLVA